MRHRANYALLNVSEHLGPHEGGLDVPWATFAGDRSSELTFEVPVEPADPYLELQAYEVGTFGHEIRINGESLSGFDLPPADGWQYWMDTLVGSELRSGKNTFRIVRDDESADSFVINNAVVNWREPIE